ncbi:type II toxin-antitoxin system RelE/ParE family toxin [Bifidobacterium sp. 82T10]|uniref:Type II toxin-antitoxin system RelE/ParE family toxin n=1 Tax=Bifidobacterium miconis TaxID=2834435 RepID=A0ABS6WER4_9BIFI|nr:type II toxin-antitoxin system RelE/ParE family toxin [Bifidobacterium miconis]MBW3092510.1 type II toxin-antitoxin system RelE/ParE family toxin [Bifidobacterium miconis]
MAWEITFTKAAQKDVARLKEPAKSHVYAMLNKVAENPLPFTEGGYGKPLGHKRDGNLTGYLKVKLKGDGLRAVYRLERTEHAMIVVIVSIRDDNTVYKEAVRRLGNER